MPDWTTKMQGKNGLSGSGTWQRAGHYIEKIQAIKQQVVRKTKHEALIIEKVIVAVLSQGPLVRPKMPNGSDFPGSEALHSVGEIVSDFIDLDSDYGPDGAVSFFLPVFGMTIAEKQADEQGFAQLCAQATSPDQPLSGIILENNAVWQVSRDVAKPVCYVRHNYLRRVPAVELEAMLDDAGLRAVGGIEALAEMIETEAREAAAEAAHRP